MSIQGLNLNSPLTYLPPGKAKGQTNVAANGGATPTSAAAGTGAGLTSTTTGTTFLNLLVKELQNQDPSAPMDSTAMVGQMISLNQLDQLISINQAIGGAGASKAGTGQTVAAAGAGTAATAQPSAQVMAVRAALEGAAAPENAMNPASYQAGNANTTLDLSNFTNQIGGK